MSETQTPDLLTALRRLAKYTDLIKYENNGFTEVFSEGRYIFALNPDILKSELSLAIIEHVLVKLAGEWEIQVERISRINRVALYSTWSAVKKGVDTFDLVYEVGQDGITSNAHALAVGLLNFKEEK